MKNLSSKKMRKILAAATIPTALVISGLTVAQASYSAYSATTTNPTSNWASGTVNLTDDDSNAAAFSVANAKPGASGSRCLVVTSNGSLPSAVRIYGANGSGTTNLAAYITLTITQGSGGSFGSCTGFTPASTDPQVFSGSLVAFGYTRTNFATGVGTWATLGGTTPESRTFMLSYTISADAPNDTMGGTAAGDIVFEAQNT